MGLLVSAAPEIVELPGKSLPGFPGGALDWAQNNRRLRTYPEQGRHGRIFFAARTIQTGDVEAAHQAQEAGCLPWDTDCLSPLRPFAVALFGPDLLPEPAREDDRKDNREDAGAEAQIAFRIARGVPGRAQEQPRR
jgi:hypothetical protein